MTKWDGVPATPREKYFLPGEHRLHLYRVHQRRVFGKYVIVAFRFRVVSTTRDDVRIGDEVVYLSSLRSISEACLLDRVVESLNDPAVREIADAAKRRIKGEEGGTDTEIVVSVHARASCDKSFFNGQEYVTTKFERIYSSGGAVPA